MLSHQFPAPIIAPIEQTQRVDDEAVIRITTQFCDVLREFSTSCSRNQLDALLDQIDEVVIELRKASADIRRSLELSAA